MNVTTLTLNLTEMDLALGSFSMDITSGAFEAFGPLTVAGYNMFRSFCLEITLIISVCAILFRSKPQQQQKRSQESISEKRMMSSPPPSLPPRQQALERRSSPQWERRTKDTLYTRWPTTAELADPEWVVSAVQQASRNGASCHGGLEIYREALRSGLDLKQLTPTDHSSLFMGLAVTAVRTNRFHEVLFLLKDARELGQGISSELYCQLTKMCTNKQVYRECLEMYDYICEDDDFVISDRITWSCLLFCAVEIAQYHRCAHLFQKVKECGGATNKDYNTRLRSLFAQGEWKTALMTLEDMKETGVAIDVIAYNSVLVMCVRANKTEIAETLLKEMEAIGGVVDAITYNTIAAQYAKSHCLDKCFQLYERMQSQGVAPSHVTYGILMDSCINQDLIDKALEVFETMVKSGCPMNSVCHNIILKGLGAVDSIESNVQALEKLKDTCPDSKVLDLLIFSVRIKWKCDRGHLDSALDLVDEMRTADLEPDESIYNTLLVACMQGWHYALARQLYDELVQAGIKPTSYTLSIMFRVYSSCKMISEAVEMLATEPARLGLKPDSRLYIQLAEACVREFEGKECIKVYKLWLERRMPAPPMHNAVLGKCSRYCMLDTALSIMRLAREAGKKIDTRLIQALYDTAHWNGEWKWAEDFEKFAEKLGQPLQFQRTWRR